MEDLLKILVVDDDSVDRLAVSRALGKAAVKMEMTEATSAKDAIALLSNHVFDCIFLDYLLPDRDGLELIRDLHRREIEAPIIVLTGQGDEQIAVEMMKAGASDYLSKNRISPEILAKTVQSAIRVRRAEREAKQANRLLKESNELLRHTNQELERQRNQIELQNLQLQEAYRLKSEFLATMSHELRTPMNAILGFAQILLRQYQDPLTSQQTNIVQRILNNAQNLLQMINEVLDFSKLESGEMTLSVSEFDLVKSIRLTVEELRFLAQQKGLRLKTDLQLSNPLVVSDSNFLRRIVINLVSNAIKFTNNGEIAVRVREITPDRLAIAVLDTGIGIASQDLETIFEEFRQVDRSLTRHYQGTGLGLAITNSLVKMLGGTITVESRLGQGSTFTVELPRRTGGLVSLKSSTASLQQLR